MPSDGSTVDKAQLGALYSKKAQGAKFKDVTGIGISDWLASHPNLFSHQAGTTAYACAVQSTTQGHVAGAGADSDAAGGKIAGGKLQATLKTHEERQRDREKAALPIFASQSTFCERLKTEKVLIVTANTGPTLMCEWLCCVGVADLRQ